MHNHSNESHVEFYILLEHMLHHNQKHIKELSVMMEKAKHIGYGNVSEEISKSIAHFDNANKLLEKALNMFRILQKGE